MKTKNDILSNFEKALKQPIEANTLSLDKSQICLLGVQFDKAEVKPIGTITRLPIIEGTASVKVSLDYLKPLVEALYKSGAGFAVLTVKQDAPLQVSAVFDYEDADGAKEATVKYVLAPNVGEDKTAPIPFKTTPTSESNNAPSEDAETTAPRDTENAGQEANAPDVIECQN